MGDDARMGLTDEQQWAAERQLLTALLNHVGTASRREMADHFRYIAAGEPEVRMYIVDLIEGREGR